MEQEKKITRLRYDMVTRNGIMNKVLKMAEDGKSVDDIISSLHKEGIKCPDGVSPIRRNFVLDILRGFKKLNAIQTQQLTMNSKQELPENDKFEIVRLVLFNPSMPDYKKVSMLKAFVGER